MLGARQCAPFRDVDDAARARRLDCVNMNACLTTAIRYEWEAFCCGDGCFQRIDAEQRAQDVEALTLLRLTVEGQCG